MANISQNTQRSIPAIGYNIGHEKMVPQKIFSFVLTSFTEISSI